MNYFLTPEAQEDLINIRSYTLVTWGAKQSAKYLTGLENCFSLLAGQPKIGRNIKELGSDAFNFQHEKHFIYYRLMENSILIFAVLHSNSLPALHLADREF